MRKFTMSLMLLIPFCSCTESLDMESVTCDVETESTWNRISKEQALNIAETYFSKSETRTPLPLKVDYVTNAVGTRNVTDNDTIAYIINRGDKQGFVLVATDNRVYPLLAYSETGDFVYKKGSPVDDMFISRLNDYYAENESNEPQEYLVDSVACQVVQPVIKGFWHQNDPFNKYIVEEHPECPAGCLAVAMCNIMTQCKDSLTYHGMKFELDRIRTGLASGSTSTSSSTDTPLTRIVNGETPAPVIVPYAYDVAVDYAAKLLYWFGKDIDMNYSKGGSTGYTSDAKALLLDLGYILPTGKLLSYKPVKVVEYLKKNCLVYMNGSSVNSLTYGIGHAWVADGCAFCLNESNDTININLHFDWGWGGQCNGFFSGDVFAVGDYKFANMGYMPVQITK